MTAENLLRRAESAGMMLATAESCTGGALSAAITDIEGASAILDRGFVTYSNAAKEQMLGVRKSTLDAFGAVSEDVAREMAEGALARSDADLAISTTGIAGPGSMGGKPEGRVCFGLAVKGHATRTETVEFGALGRAKVREATIAHALDLLLSALPEVGPV